MAKMMLVNPRSRKKAVRRRKRAPVRRRRSTVARGRRRNPSLNANSIMTKQVQPAATAAAGALGLDILWGYAPLPEEWKAGPLRHLVKGAGAIGLGFVAQNFVKRSTADQLATGALTVVLHDMGREALGQFMPGIPMGDYLSYPSGGSMGYYNPGQPMGMYMSRPAPAPVPSNGDTTTVEGYDI